MAAVDAEMRRHIETVLARIEREEGVRVVYAAESGSRAWGFPSPDSDFDVRFIYVHPRLWYLGLDEGRDVIERPLDERDVDLAGWDVRKALRLLLRSNPALYEWLVSPIVYRDDGVFRNRAAPLFAAHASARTLAHHYHAIAAGVWKRNIDGHDAVRLKRYLYVARPLLSLQWVARQHTMPPMTMHELLAACDVPADVRRALDDLLALKRETPELGDGPRVAAIDRWVLAQIGALAPAGLSLSDAPASAQTRDAVDDLYRATAGL